MVALVKAAYELCHGSGIDYFVLAGRRPITAIYRSMLFDDLLEGSTIALPYAGDLPHSVFSMPIRDADRRWRESGHALYDFMARTEHPDIAIDYQRVFAAFGRAMMTLTSVRPCEQHDYEFAIHAAALVVDCAFRPRG